MARPPRSLVDEPPPKSSKKELAWLALAVTLLLVGVFLAVGGAWFRWFPSG
jgi:hypothetical protein